MNKDLENQKIVTFGELMLRLKSPAKERFLQSPCFEAIFGGSEANVAVSLSILGKKSCFVTALPSSPLGKEAKSSLLKYGVEVNSFFNEGRLGLYFLEDGACQRPSQVIYDRENSVFSKTKPLEYDWENSFCNASWFHVSGVTAAVSQESSDSALYALKKAKEKGITTSLDLNFRKKLWKYGKTAPEVMTKLAEYADVLIANEEDIQNCLGIPLENDVPVPQNYEKLCKNVRKNFPSVKYVAVTLRQSISADTNGWSAVLSGRTGFFQSARYEIENIVERVGAGDAFAAGLIFALSDVVLLGEKLLDGKEKNISLLEQNALDFACAAGALKHSFSGDFNLATKQEVEFLMKGNTNGRIQR